MSDFEGALYLVRLTFGILLSTSIASGRRTNSTRASLRSVSHSNKRLLNTPPTSLASRDTPQANMAPAVTKARYPKRKRATVDYDVDKSFADVSELEDEEDGYHSEELGEDSTVSDGSNNAAGAAGGAGGAQPSKTVTTTPSVDDHDHDSEYEDATYGSRRKLKKRKIAGRVNGRFQAKPKPPKFKPFPLMDLPPELRLKVYDEALVDPDGVTIRTFTDKYESTPVHVAVSNIRTAYFLTPKWYHHGKWTEVPANQLPRKKNQLSPNLIAASKTIHGEASKKLWEQPFLFSDVQGLHAFLLMLRPETIARLRDITILQHGWNNHKVLPAFVLLRDAPLLRNLRLDCRIRPDIRAARAGHNQENSMGQQIATRLYSNCHPFLKALIKERGSGAILEVIKFSREEFKNNYYDHVTNHWVRIDWDQERENKILAAVTEELKVIMNRTIVPRFRRSRY
ncbi:hypothetical protein KVR01_012080 [Diaporthe batatas]|uniref:uncharacterized protein n=1 Tax=Diaporthe batatas TaxID=748121 RepID=UPI001D048B78|nr:uncharacterized protein KVR01_012080 [Diaporthe batatas]KAG8158319.1 hypothetical protein KVR01_012080 [Diaporthe batatas]